jgi:CRISPR-associated protein Csb3
LEGKFNLRLDWWRDEGGGGARYKTWAGQQKVVGIATAMHRALQRAARFGTDLFQFGEVLPDPDEPKRSVAPFYFDSRRAAGAHNLDIGFSSDALRINTLSFPAVEFLCLVGLQRFRARESDDRTFVYQTWPIDWPLEPVIAAAVACRACSSAGCKSYRFRFLFRTKYLKGFLPAIPNGGDE